MIKLKISYEHPEELRAFLARIAPMVQRYKQPKERKGRYYRAYADIVGAGSKGGEK